MLCFERVHGKSLRILCECPWIIIYIYIYRALTKSLSIWIDDSRKNSRFRGHRNKHNIRMYIINLFLPNGIWRVCKSQWIKTIIHNIIYITICTTRYLRMVINKLKSKIAFYFTRRCRVSKRADRILSSVKRNVVIYLFIYIHVYISIMKYI